MISTSNPAATSASNDGLVLSVAQVMKSLVTSKKENNEGGQWQSFTRQGLDFEDGASVAYMCESASEDTTAQRTSTWYKIELRVGFMLCEIS